jgi:hypothetical protein
MAKRRRIDKYNGQKKKDRQIQLPKEEGYTNTPSFGHCICLSFFWPLYLSILLLLAIVFVYPYDQKKDRQIQWLKEEG